MTQLNEDPIADLDKKIMAIKSSLEYRGLITKQRGPADEAHLRDINLRLNAFENQKKMYTKPKELAKKMQIMRRNRNAAVAPQIETHGVIKARAANSPHPELVQTPEHKNGREDDEEISDDEMEIVKEPVNQPKVLKRPGRPGKPIPPAPGPVVQPPQVIGAPNTVVKDKKHFKARKMSPLVGTPPPPAAPVVKLQLSPAAMKGTAPAAPPAPVTKTQGNYSTLGKSGKPMSKGSTKAPPLTSGAAGTTKKPAIGRSITAPPPPAKPINGHASTPVKGQTKNNTSDSEEEDFVDGGLPDNIKLDELDLDSLNNLEDFDDL